MMNDELHKRLMAELSRPGRPWKTSPNHESQKEATLQWLPIVNLTAARIELGISSDARWLRATSQSATVFSPDKSPVFLLPVLEIEFSEVRHLIEHGLQARGLSTEFVRMFPFEDVVCTGLESHSERWAALALKWAEQLPTSPKLQTALRVLSTNGPTQKLRHAGQNQLAQQRNTT
jgi:hypothetical protein